MSKSNDGSKLDHGTLEDHRPLADNELDAVTGGVLDYEGQPVVTYSLVSAWPDWKWRSS
jgi:hypothetical protein